MVIELMTLGILKISAKQHGGSSRPSTNPIGTVYWLMVQTGHSETILNQSLVLKSLMNQL